MPRSRRNAPYGLTANDMRIRGVPGFNPRKRSVGNGRSAMLLGRLDGITLLGRKPIPRSALKGWHVGYIPEGKRLVLIRSTKRKVGVDALSASVRKRHREFHERDARAAVLYDLPDAVGAKQQAGLIESLTYVVPPSVDSPSKQGYRWVHAFGDHGESGHGPMNGEPKKYPTSLMPALDVDRHDNLFVRRRPGNKYDVTTWIYW